MSDHHPHERPEREHTTSSPRRDHSNHSLAPDHDTPPTNRPNYEAGSQTVGVIHRQVAAERAARRAAAGEPEPPPLLETNMPAHMRHGPGSQTANAFYQQAARRRLARESNPLHKGAKMARPRKLMSSLCGVETQLQTIKQLDG